MDDAPEVDVTKLMEEVRAKIRARQQELSGTDATTLPANDTVASDVTSLQSDYDIYHINFASHRKALGRLVVLAKKALRQLMTPILERQLAYNAANARVVAYLYEQLEGRYVVALQELSERLDGTQQQQSAALRALRTEVMEELEGMHQQQVADLQVLRTEVMEQLAETVMGQLKVLGEQQTAAFQELQGAVLSRLEPMAKVQVQLKELERAVLRLKTELRSHEHRLEPMAKVQVQLKELERTVLRLKAELRLQEHRLNLMLEEARKRLPGPFAPEQLQSLADEERHALDAFFVALEDRFRGSREEIKEWLRVYLPIIREMKLCTEEMLVLDLGCGRGEWLELLRDEGLRARGVDMNRVVIEACRQQELDVVEDDVVGYLRSLPDASVGVVTAFHLIEHLTFEAFIKLLDETVRVLKPGGAAFFETPNPKNVLVGSHDFYLDPTHRNPLPSLLVKFMAEARGLCRVEIMPLHPWPTVYRVAEAGIEVAKNFNDYFYGPQAYAMIGWKV